MDEQSQTPKAPEIQINTGDDILRGKFSNNLMVAHSADEFILDWLMNAPRLKHSSRFRSYRRRGIFQRSGLHMMNPEVRCPPSGVPVSNFTVA